MSAAVSYLGAKNGSGVYQAIINLMPPHETYIEPFLGTGAVMRRKAPAKRSIGIDKNEQCVNGFDYGAPEIDGADYVVPELFVGDAFSFLADFDYAAAGKTLIYCDPPYVHSTRTSNARYQHELTDAQHRELLEILKQVPAFVILSGYRNDIYDKTLADWWSKDFQAMTRGGVRTETVWCNFEPGKVHYHRYAGKNATDRQRIQRKAARWAKNFSELPQPEKQAILAALLASSE
ncbi:DNA adenine methylase [Rheinheimera texasensis]|uniref:DNA adenine methylase n=1 Tax=Rheinheimera texasensis TaxID=306205 RepID=UPI0032B23232